LIIKSVLLFQQAITANSYHQAMRPLRLHSSLLDHDKVIDFDWTTTNCCSVDGSIHIGGQEHFYLETQSCLVLPGESGSDELKVIVSAQCINDVQVYCRYRNMLF